jgi:hypothetical protein
MNYYSFFNYKKKNRKSNNKKSKFRKKKNNYKNLKLRKLSLNWNKLLNFIYFQKGTDGDKISGMESGNESMIASKITLKKNS